MKIKNTFVTSISQGKLLCLTVIRAVNNESIIKIYGVSCSSLSAASEIKSSIIGSSIVPI